MRWLLEGFLEGSGVGSWSWERVHCDVMGGVEAVDVLVVGEVEELVVWLYTEEVDIDDAVERREIVGRCWWAWAVCWSAQVGRTASAALGDFSAPTGANIVVICMFCSSWGNNPTPPSVEMVCLCSPLLNRHGLVPAGDVQIDPPGWRRVPCVGKIENEDFGGGSGFDVTPPIANDRGVWSSEAHGSFQSGCIHPFIVADEYIDMSTSAVLVDR
ncbi:hypothetical protein DFH27DRAFT_535018 [Peziza echinospora]|nr:hypothetical protein DFH27DRAFT_535018 [Peziza echinospora]